LKAKRIAATEATTVLVLETETIFDMARQGSEAIGDGFGLDVRNHVADTTRPELDSFDLSVDGETGRLLMTFTETVQLSTFNPTGIRLQSTPGTVGSGLILGIDLTEDTTVTPGEVDGPVVSITIGERDLNALKRVFAPGIAANLGSTFHGTKWYY